MPCLVLTGHPSVGKTTFAHLLKDRALQHKSKSITSVVIVNEESVCLNCTKSECYQSSHAEKSTRSSLKAAVDRSLRKSSSGSSGNSKTLVICDSMNYIKGYRYELHCLSKAAQQQHGVIWILNSDAMELNRKQREETNESKSKGQGNNDFFTDDQMHELIQRYEPPDSRNRWDKPLWRVDLSKQNSSSLHSVNQAAQEALKQSVYNMHELGQAMNILPDSDSSNDQIEVSNAEEPPAKPKTLTSFKRIRRNDLALQQARADVLEMTPTKVMPSQTDKLESNPGSTSENTSCQKDSPLDQQIDSILDEFLLHVAPLKEGFSTRQHVNAQSNVLHEVDSLTLQICNSLMKAQQQQAPHNNHLYGSSFVLTLPEILRADESATNSVRMKCSRHVPLAELKRLRKQYIQWVSRVPPEDTSHQGLVQSFVQYVEAQVNK